MKEFPPTIEINGHPCSFYARTSDNMILVGYCETDSETPNKYCAYGKSLSEALKKLEPIICSYGAQNAAIGPVNHPKHYNSHPSGIECIEVARHFDFNVGSAIKYLWRHGLKHSNFEQASDKAVEDLQKAVWYINDEINLLKH